MNVGLVKFKQDIETLRNEYQVCRQKLDSKCEAVLILTQDLDQCRQERDQFKLMAEQVQARYQTLKRQLAGVGPRPTSLEGLEFSDMKQQSLAQLLCEMREVNKTLQFENDDWKSKLKDAQGDIKLLREQIARQRVGTTDEGMNTRHFPAYEREDLVIQLEAARVQQEQLQRDVQQVIDEKEEQEMERDAYKNKYERLNHELNYILKGDERRVVDIDALVMENKYLQERMKQMEEEKSMAMATVTKYKTILEKRKNKGILKLGQSRSGGVVISQKQVQQLLENRSVLAPSHQMMADLQSLSAALLETVNDKNLAISHQRKTNKILGGRVSELEKKLRTLEVAGLWNLPGKNSGLDKLKIECESIKSLLPKQDCKEETGSDETSILHGSDLMSMHNDRRSHNAGLIMEGLDLLPTRDFYKGEPAIVNTTHMNTPSGTPADTIQDLMSPGTTTSPAAGNAISLPNQVTAQLKDMILEDIVSRVTGKIRLGELSTEEENEEEEETDEQLFPFSLQSSPRCHSPVQDSMNDKMEEMV